MYDLTWDRSISEPRLYRRVYIHPQQPKAHTVRFATLNNPIFHPNILQNAPMGKVSGHAQARTARRTAPYLQKAHPRLGRQATPQTLSRGDRRLICGVLPCLVGLATPSRCRTATASLSDTYQRLIKEGVRPSFVRTRAAKGAASQATALRRCLAGGRARTGMSWQPGAHGG